MTLCLALLLNLGAAWPSWGAAETLPGPVVHPYSFEVLANSRYSIHSGFTDSLPRQALANVLWAMNRVPRLGTGRELYVATRNNVYQYEPSGNALVLHKAGDHRYSSSSAFEVGIACDQHEEAGMAIQAGLLAGAAFADSAGPGVGACPMKWAADNANAEWNPATTIRMVNVYGQVQAEGVDTLSVAVSSDTSLPRPRVVGADSFELVLMDLAQDSVFASFPLGPDVISQLLWAGYGPTPHYAYNGRRGLTVPSAVAAYHLTGRIYLVRAEGVDRYRNRPPSGNMNQADHRLERLVAGDRRSDLRLACPRIPSTAPDYVVVCVNDTSAYGPMQEAGFTGFHYLCQARCLGLAAFITAPLTREERSGIAAALGLPSADAPVLVFSAGEPATGIAEEKRIALAEIVRAKPAIRPDEVLEVKYLLRQAGPVRIEVFDLLGRPVRRLLDQRQSAGYHRLVWDATDSKGRRVKTGSYVLTIIASGTFTQHKVAVF